MSQFQSERRCSKNTIMETQQRDKGLSLKKLPMAKGKKHLSNKIYNIILD